IRLEPHAAAVTAIPTVGAATRDEFLATEADAPRAAVPALDMDVDLVDEHQRFVGREDTRSRDGPGPSGRLVEDADVARVAASLEADVAVDLRDQGVVP